MAIEIVTTTTLAIGSKTMSHFGAIVSRLAAIDDLAGLNMLCSDKTGTLTKNKMTIQDDTPTYEPNLTQMDLLKQSALAAKWESPPKDALDTLFLRCHLWHPDIKQVMEEFVQKNPNATIADKDEYYNKQINAKLQEALADYESLAFMPFDPRIKRTESTVREKSTGKIFKITKGAPHIIEPLDKDHEKGKKMAEKVAELGSDGIRAVTIAISEPLNDQWVMGAEEQHVNPVWHITGMLTFLDPPRDDTKATIAKSEAYGVPVRMITGDNILIAKKTCKDLQMGRTDRPEWPLIQGPDHLPMLDKDGNAPKDLVQKYGAYIKNADGFAQVFPEHKYLVVETFKRLGYKCGMTGDGVNDAPALKKADVGIAVAGATDAARAAADIVLTQEGLSTIILGMEIARSIFARMKSFLTYRIAATLQLLTFFFIAVFAFKPSDYGSHEGVPDYDRGVRS
jgi:H+-transporting ATPase